MLALLLVGCGSSTKPVELVAGAGADAGVTQDGGPPDSGVVEDSGTADSGVAEAAPCERTLGVCAGARRAMVAGEYEPVCTARSYGADYEATETRCDGLDNDCDGVTDPATWTEVTPMAWTSDENMVDSLPVEGGFLVVVSDRPGQLQVLRLDTALAVARTTIIQFETGSSTTASVARLVRTSRGPALFYVVMDSTLWSSQGRLLPLNEQGEPTTQPPGVTVFHQPASYINAQVAASVDRDRGMVIWSSNANFGLNSIDLLTRLVDADGQALTEPQVLFWKDEAYGTLLSFSPRALGLKDGGFLAMAVEFGLGGSESRIRLRRYDRNLLPVGEERMLTVGHYIAAQLVMAPAAGGADSGEPMVLLREIPGPNFRIQQIQDLFDGGVPETVTTTTPGDSPAVWATMTSRGLQVAWISMRFLPVAGLDSYFNCEGRLWGLSPSGVVTDWTPGGVSMPMHRQSDWVMMQELPGQWMGALLMTATGNPPEPYTLRALRYCAP
ncbi:putative metal-binding motif-containing protein [Corallococcus sp. Z5C101001]|uniref:putative metal-binding motif-containing protein n=1 Tax=Corallococcus sp. Z5C101001 TaxID=2596829 RepID=UPI00117D17A7|nr:putative metal-binding motif-containing protein [Corallococcus sp. Z5C101001]TSC23518.1 hypothetical protein FOF48_28565 [Corallococcus sp. Z5C101001]